MTLREYIKDWIGVPYLWGGTTKKGVDCSGFVIDVYENYMKQIIKNRVSYDIYKEIPNHIDPKDLKEGDILFFKMSSDKISHMGIYLGNFEFAHAGSKGVGIAKLNIKYWQDRLYKGGRF